MIKSFLIRDYKVSSHRRHLIASSTLMTIVIGTDFDSPCHCRDTHDVATIVRDTTTRYTLIERYFSITESVPLIGAAIFLLVLKFVVFIRELFVSVQEKIQMQMLQQ